MAKSPLRYRRLLQEIPKHKNAKDAIIAAGFSVKTADGQSKRVLRSAIRHQAKEILDSTSGNMVSVAGTKKLMSDIVGLSMDNLFERLRFIATQERDLASALKVLGPLAKEHGIVLNADEQPKNVTPSLSIVVKEVNVDGRVEPDNGFVEPPK